VTKLSDFDLPFILSISVSVFAVILTYMDMRRRLKQEREFSKSMAELINTLREKSKTSTEDIAKQNLLAQREEQQWNRLKDIAKAIGWIIEHSEENEDT